jgi:hypothetical protein
MIIKKIDEWKCVNESVALDVDINAVKKIFKKYISAPNYIGEKDMSKWDHTDLRNLMQSYILMSDRHSPRPHGETTDEITKMFGVPSGVDFADWILKNGGTKLNGNKYFDGKSNMDSAYKDMWDVLSRLL